MSVICRLNILVSTYTYVRTTDQLVDLHMCECLFPLINQEKTTKIVRISIKHQTQNYSRTIYSIFCHFYVHVIVLRTKIKPCLLSCIQSRPMDNFLECTCVGLATLLYYFEYQFIKISCCH